MGGGGGGNRAPVTEYDEMQELEAARERNDLDVTDLLEMSVAELRAVGRELELDTRADGNKSADLSELGIGTFVAPSSENGMRKIIDAAAARLLRLPGCCCDG